MSYVIGLLFSPGFKIGDKKVPEVLKELMPDLEKSLLND